VVGQGERGLQKGQQPLIKVTQKQIVNERTSRKRAATKHKRQSKKTDASAYTATKKQVQKRIRKLRAAEYKSIGKHINQLPRGERQKARTTARKGLMARQKELFRRMTGAKKMNLRDLKKLLTAAIRF
jgi:hypothetical protein